MKRIIFIAGLLCISVSGYAQNQSVMHLSLQQAIKLGLKNRFDVQANQYDILQADNALRKSRKVWIPDIHAVGNIRYNTQLQATYIPKGFAGLTEPGLLAFGADNETIFGLELKEPVYRPGIATDVKIAKDDVAMQKEKKHADKIEIKNTIAIAYLNVLLKKLQYRIASDDENRFKEYLALAEGKYHDGVLIKNDYLRVQLDYNNARVQTETAMQNYGLSLDNLKYQINVPVETSIALSDSIGSIKMGTNQLTAADAIDSRTEIKQLKLQQRMNSLQLARVRQNALPSISVLADYSQQFLSTDFNYGNSKWWSPFSYLGLQLNIPITFNFMNHNNIQQYKLRRQQTEWEIKQETATINFEILKAATDLHNASQNMKTTKKNYELSQTIYANQRQQFKLGAFRYEQLLDTERSVAKAEQNYIQSVYDYLVARLNYLKAMGRL